jgi:2-hydroxy-3-oxopropionate reductase
MRSLSGQKIGFIGLGKMGEGMTRNLLKAGAELLVADLNPAAVQAIVDDGATAMASAAEISARVDVVILMVDSTPAVESVLFGDGGIVSAIHAGLLVVDMGTTGITATKGFAERVRAAGGDFMDAPVSGGAEGARDGTLAIMAGGSEAAFARARPILQAMGARVTHLGEVGAGQVAKAVNQIIVGVTIQGVAEGITLARKAGVDPAKVRDAIRGGYAESRILERHALKMIERDFEAGGYVTITHKDLVQAAEFADELRVDLPALKLSESLYRKVIDDGFGKLDHAAVIKAIDPDA